MTSKFRRSSTLSDEDVIQDSQDYYESECARIANFQETLHQFITRASAANYKSEVRLEDSISNVGSRKRTQSRASHESSRKSGGGSLAHEPSPRLVAAAKRASLQADGTTLHEQQALRHPIPTVEELLQDLNGSTFFSKIDLKWGFHQIFSARKIDT